MPSQPASASELTLRGLLLGALITTVFTAANVYLGLKVGLTFASSIPAAVISMAVLRFVRGSSILENNIVQTVASAAGTLSCVIFVLPGLVIVGWWSGFPFWTSFLICVSGGVLGVLYTIPLRRALVTRSDLPYPEGVAAAEVLKVGSQARGEAGEGFLAIVLGAVASAGLAVVSATRIVSTELAGYLRVGAQAATGYDAALSLALLGAGHIVGLSIGMAMLVGLVVAWAAAVPILSHLHPAAAGISLADHVDFIWGRQVRFVGAGAIAVAAIWTLARLAKPVVGGLISTIVASRAVATDDERDRDLGPRWILGLTAACLAVGGALAVSFVRSTPIEGSAAAVTAVALPIILVVGFVLAAVTGYMAGLIGATNSPISGVGILAVVLGASVIVLAVPPTPATREALVAFVLFVTSIVVACATISNDNLQDLKTGQLVGASPRRQQIALMVGVVAGAVVIPPVLDLLARAYGFAGAANVGATAEHPLAAPQATLISALAQGVVGGSLDWTLIGIGALVGAAMIAIDALLGRLGLLRLPPLAVGMGIYLPMSSTFAVVVGSLTGRWYAVRIRRAADPARAEQLGVLVASGLIVGESLFGVLNAGLIVAFATDAPLGLVPASFPPASILGVLAFIAMVVWLYRWMLRRVS
ncbi:MAG TPA: oligopeptide transporter, OPT family [Haliangiales bacterium]|nr:oligopeptide transporter, OPT family [Haliangiales bacterium]